MKEKNKKFWNELDELVAKNEITIDRPQGSVHPRYKEYIYPHDYGYITNTTSTDGAEIDCWIGTKQGSKLASKQVDGVVVTIDSTKHDSEIKILINCTEADMAKIVECHNRGSQGGLLLERPKSIQ